MSDEVIDICDENNVIAGKELKSIAHEKGLWHRAAHIWIYTSGGEVLLQWRAKEKKLFPDMWDISAAGHIGAGDEPLNGAVRELEEELGITVDKNELELVSIRKQPAPEFGKLINNEFYYVYFLKYDGDLEHLHLQEEEVQAVQSVSLDKLESDLTKNPGKYVPHTENYWGFIVSELRKRMK